MVRSTSLLDGSWLFRPDPHRLGELYREQLHYSHASSARWCEPDTDLSAWERIAVPGLWTRQGHPTVECGWYRLDFQAQPHSGISTLAFDGVDYFTDVWLNGRYLGSHEGCYGPFTFDVSDVISERNALVVRVDSPWDVPGIQHEIGQLKRLFRGALERWDMNDPESKPAGIWGSVRLERTGLLRIASASIEATPTMFPPSGQPDEAVPVEGHISILVESSSASRATLRYHVRPHGFEGDGASGDVEFACRSGERHLGIDFLIDSARLWWTWDLGQPRRYEVVLELSDSTGQSDGLAFLTGFRSLQMPEGWNLLLNGVPLYQRGANYLSDLDLSSVTPDRYADDVAMLRRANLNTVHPFAVVEADAFYEACDNAGLIVYQDFPIWMMSDPSSDVVRAAVRVFDEIHARLRNHPSIAVWNFGSQPSVANFEKLCVALYRHARRRDPSRIPHHGNSAISYSSRDDVHPERSFFWTEASAERFERAYDWRRDCHMYPGWYLGDAEAIKTVDPRHFSLVTEFGAQSLPRLETLAEFTDVTASEIRWADLAARCGQPELLRRHNPRSDTLKELVTSSQKHQAEVVRHDIEFIRSRKIDGGRGLHVFAFNDCWPAVSWAVVEYDRTPKPAYHAVQIAMSPVQVFLEDYIRIMPSGSHERRMTIVNDTSATIDDARLLIAIKSDVEPSVVVLPTIPPCGAVRTSASFALDRGSTEVLFTLQWAQGSVQNRYLLTAD